MCGEWIGVDGNLSHRRGNAIYKNSQVTKDKGMVALNWLVNDQPLTMKDQVRLLVGRRMGDGLGCDNKLD